jgi:hydrogenase maturation protease
MSRILIAGVGNVFLGDDGFGVAVAQRLVREPLPEGARVADFGIRAMHLAFELLDPPDLFILVDATAQGGAPGTLYVIDPATEDLPGTAEEQVANAHAMHPGAVLAAVRQMRGTLPRTRIVGCEPADVAEGMELSDPVRAAIEPAVAIVRRLVESEVRS